MSEATRQVASSSQTAGPFFQLGLPHVPPPDVHDPIRLVVRVTDGNGCPVDDALVELWYLAQDSHGAGVQPVQATFARESTDRDGSCHFALPPPASVPPERRSSPHINVCIFARGLLRQLHTRLYFEDEQTLEHDALLALVAPERRRTLIARRTDEDRSWVFHVRLQGEDETVFFAL